MVPSVPRIWSTGGGESFVKSFALTLEDHMATRYARTEALPFGRFAAFVVLCAAFFGLVLAYQRWLAGERVWAAVTVLGAVAAGLLAAHLSYGFFRGFFNGFWRGFLEKREAVDVPLEVTVDGSGLSVLVRGQTWFCPWDSLASVEEDGDRFYFWTSTWQAHVLPKRVFEPGELTAFESALEGWLGAPPISPPRRAGAPV